MIIQEHVPLSSLTTLRVGGNARYVIECETVDDVRAALKHAADRGLSWSVLGSGSNVLAKDAGYEGVVLIMRVPGIAYEEGDASVTVTAGAGMSWDALVHVVANRGLWGLENLAGIPGTVGASPVQNIGAYCAEVKDTLHAVEVLDTETGKTLVFTNEQCAFGYRESRFKHSARYVIMSVSFSLLKHGQPNTHYKDLVAAAAQGATLSTPSEIGSAIREIRARKFPDLTKIGTAGSFFKNPTISEEQFRVLKERHADMPGFPNDQGVKIPIAFVLDHLLQLRGFSAGNVSLFENHALVLVTRDGATGQEVDVFANSIAARVHDATGIHIEREVRSFPTKGCV